MCAAIDREAVRVLPVFRWIAERGGLSEKEMFSTFNMGVGMTVIVGAEDADRALQILRNEGENACVIGEIVPAQDDSKIEINGI